MNETRTARRARAEWTRPAPDPVPACSGCGRAVQLQQPDQRKPGQLLGVCTHPQCGEWTIFCRVENRLVVARRIPAAERVGPEWTVARPATKDTARRA